MRFVLYAIFAIRTVRRWGPDFHAFVLADIENGFGFSNVERGLVPALTEIIKSFMENHPRVSGRRGNKRIDQHGFMFFCSVLIRDSKCIFFGLR